MKKLMFFAAAMLMCFSTACSDSDDNGDNGGTTKKEYVKSTVKLDYVYSGALFDLIDITTVEVLIDGKKSTTATVSKGDGSIKIDFGAVKPLSKATVNILTERNSNAVDETKTYDHKSNFNYTVTRHFSDNTTDFTTLTVGGHNIGGLELETIEEYIQLYGDDSSTIEINSQGTLAF